MATAPPSDEIPRDRITEAGLAADVSTLGYANKPGEDETMRDAGADVVLDSMAELAESTGRTPAP
jgi:phosphoglycolate phosphatase-like HAD superfamily hydrolase